MKPVKLGKSKHGRPATGHDALISARIPQHLRDRVDAWAERHGIPRSLAIRRLLAGSDQAQALRPAGYSAERVAGARRESVIA
jgi:hypothetical protein